jgi:phosphatidylserine/phosphatidylglycerophosphate/cardiolipin synthase-like enzyme
MGVYFGAEDAVLNVIEHNIETAQRKVRFMTFSFTVDLIGDALIERAGAGVDVRGIFERTGSETEFSELTPLFCAGLTVRQDGNDFILHHKVFIIDDTTVITGSFNVSNNAADSNDENLVVITDSDLAAQYTAEFDRRWAEATAPSGLSCN